MGDGDVGCRANVRRMRVSEYCLKKALATIDDNDYQQVFEKHVADKLKTLRSEKNIFIKKRKLQDHLLQKGFEMDMIRSAVNKI